MIDGDFFQSVAHVTWSDNMELGSNVQVLMYAKTEDQHKALEFMRGRLEKFILITHNGDCSAEVSPPLPDNLVKWYACNTSTTESYPTQKTEPIPIGFENTRWHPKKRDILKRIKKEFDQNPAGRSMTPFACFNPKTHPQERENLQYLINGGHIDANTTNCVNGVNYEEYIRNLFTHRFCLCPRGNGIDTHRIWEALYCGCIPIIKSYGTHLWLDWEAGTSGKLSESNLSPFMQVNSWIDVTEEVLSKTSSIIPSFTSDDLPILTTKFWKNKIERTFEDAN